MTRAIYEEGYSKEDARLGYRASQLERRPVQAGGTAVYEIKIFEDENDVVVGDGRFWWPIPEELDLAEVIAVEAGVSTVSSSGSVQLQIRHFLDDGTTDDGDVLTDKITIEAGEKNSRQATVQPTITGGSFVVNHGDWLRLDVDAAGVDAKGLSLMVTATPSPLGGVTVRGSQGPAGGVTTWTGAWTTATNYTTGQSVSHNGSSYVARQDHTSGATSEPGVGVDWEDYWQLLSEGHTISELAVHIGGNGYVLTTGTKVYLPVYFDCDIVEATLVADLSGSIVIDIWKDTYGNYPPNDADSITASAPLTLVGANKTTDTALTGWTTAINADDVLGFNIDSCSAITHITVALKVERM